MTRWRVNSQWRCKDHRGYDEEDGVLLCDRGTNGGGSSQDGGWGGEEEGGVKER